MPADGLFSLDNEVAVVIGGGGVLAGAMAAGLAQAGARIAIAGRTREHADARAQDIVAQGGQAMGIQCDATSKADLQKTLDAVIERFGQVDVLINAAGVNSATPFFEIGEEEWHRILDIDLKSVFLACQVFGKAMVDAKRGGSIINITSASSGPPLSRVFTYGVAKAGVNQITMFLARELAPHNIRVNCMLFGTYENAGPHLNDIAPGFGDWWLRETPMHRFGKASESAGTALYLASQASAYVTGAIIPVSGGMGLYV